jgi:hypothetical protein
MKAFREFRASAGFWFKVQNWRAEN